MNLSVLQLAPQVSCAAGCVLISEGQPLQGVYFLESGEVEVFKNGVLIAEIFEPGAIMGEMSWLLATVPTATVKTSTPCTFRHVANPPEFFREHPDATVHMAVILARRLDSLNRYLVEIKNQFKDRADHLGIIDEVLDSLMHKHPRNIPRRDAGD
jgi:CRP/FNR family cyclic AMP-dependent transcriptional regulator